ncbi:acyl-CoA thioesterase [Sulfitobacter sp. F26169L]|uniref:acyl-CoA thioesterase n=1 Tax=Sulfitobacter sp. F26169L TaxID=2996015 RepID=UPI002260A04A|nr:acyl-CoA thioesterase [Sulfitobacter sp. F26169L]MCX7565743.1 acyl-CoA thioesterase [Sulfitobacter sp. F26169L]
MFPFIRLFKDMYLARRQPRFDSLTDTLVSHHICWPLDLDIFLELNNGRALTLYDLGRTVLAQRAGLIDVLRRKRWALTVAGSHVRFRRRIRAFERFTVRSRAICWDDKFMYIEQSMWKRDGECASHVLYRAAVTDNNGIVLPPRVLAALGQDAVSPAMPEWVSNWTRAEATRPWPPMQDM